MSLRLPFHYAFLHRILLIGICCLLPAAAFAAQFIRIASFNIAEFGEGDRPQQRDIPAIARMLAEHNLDLIALQEVGVKAVHATQVKILTEELNRVRPEGASRFYYFVTPPSGDERYAVIYRFPVQMEDGVDWVESNQKVKGRQAGGETFFRVPTILTFQAHNFDFKLGIMHLTWGNLDRREKEMQALETFLRQERKGEQDWIFVGDMNRYGKYQKKDKKAFDALLRKGWQTFYRFPLLEAITEPDDMTVFSAPADEKSTTIAGSRDLYDQIIISRGAYREFGRAKPEFNIHAGIIAFDRLPPYNAMKDHNEIKYTISDHRPIWARFQIDLDDDD